MKNHLLKCFFLLFGIFFYCIAAYGQESTDTFTNPLLPSGPDPWVIYQNEYFYYTHTQGNRLTIWKTKDITDLKNAESKTVWTAPETGPNSNHIWAPEIHYLQDKWYIYYAADDGDNANHRMFVLENSSEDPLQGEWIDRGQLVMEPDRWAIDLNVFEHRGKLYAIWSGWETRENISQDIYIGSMSNPWTTDSERVRISQPMYDWEKKSFIRRDNTPGPLVNEGPVTLKRNGKIFLVFSASHCSRDSYALGMLIADEDSDLLDPDSWEKHPEPILEQSPENGVYGPGHNSFFQSPDGTEDWILYHANPKPGLGCGGNRSPRMQRVYWRTGGTPYIGEPVPADVKLPKPSAD